MSTDQSLATRQPADIVTMKEARSQAEAVAGVALLTNALQVVGVKTLAEITGLDRCGVEGYRLGED